MYKTLTIFFFALFITSAFGQYSNSLKVGLYSSLNDLLTNSPKFECLLNVKQRSEQDIKMVAGNDYKVESENDSVRSKIIKKAFAVFNGENLYINGIYINGCKHFCLVENNGRILLLKASIPRLFKRKALGFTTEMIGSDFSLYGGAIGGAIQGAQNAMLRFYYCFDLLS